MKQYNWQQSDWPHFRYDLSGVQDLLISIMEKSGYVRGKLAHLTQELQQEALLNILVEEALKTSEIEGEILNRPDVRSSLKKQLGFTQETVRVHDKRAQGIAELLVDVQNKFSQPLTDTMLFDWHLMLLSASQDINLRVGYWRISEEAMQIISGRSGKQTIHFEAPPAASVPHEMQQFIRWFNETAPGKANAITFAPVRAAIAHLYFESIHPFDDGNGRVGRAIAEKALSQGLGYPVVLSLSQAIDQDKKAYYDALKKASDSNEITAWIHYFVNLVLVAQQEAASLIHFILTKAQFFDKYKQAFNPRQLKVIQRMLQAGSKGFEGGMSAKKYMSITGASKATATRDLQNLVLLQALKQTGEGRGVRYELNLVG